MRPGREVSGFLGILSGEMVAEVRETRPDSAVSDYATGSRRISRGPHEWLFFSLELGYSAKLEFDHLENANASPRENIAFVVLSRPPARHDQTKKREP